MGEDKPNFLGLTPEEVKPPTDGATKNQTPNTTNNEAFPETMALNSRDLFREMLYLVEALEKERESHREILTEDRNIINDGLKRLITRFSDLSQRLEQDRAQFKAELKLQRDEFGKREIIQKARLEQLRKLVARHEETFGLVAGTRQMRVDDVFTWIGIATVFMFVLFGILWGLPYLIGFVRSLFS